MKLLAISDTYIPLEYMRQGLAVLADYGVTSKFAAGSTAR